MPDIYCYPNTNILRNKANITDKNELFQFEADTTFMRLSYLQTHPIKGKFDFNHLCKIHKYIFQDIYEWAGKPRTVDIAKGSLFCLERHISTYANSIFPAYYDDCMRSKNNKNKFIHTLTYHYANLNALHPFREGNGRTQREFARELCLECRYIFDLTQTKHEEMLQASILSLNRGDNTELENIFQKAIRPISEYIPDKPNTLQILSSDDMPKNIKRRLPKLPDEIAPETLELKNTEDDQNYYEHS